MSSKQLEGWRISQYSNVSQIFGFLYYYNTMLRPGGFPEYNPAEQKIFDTIIQTLTKVFEQHHYDHIWTPAVEPVDIIKRGGDIVDKQVYGLFGLAQGTQDVKEYALHFDLTVPLARYILDHRNDLTFPFRRYQMQPVWRGERTKRGRFKEFWQFDIDAIRPSETMIGVWYDIETVAVLSKAMDAVCDVLDISINKLLKISHIGLTKAFLQAQGCDEESMNQVLGLLDNYFKIDPQEFVDKLAQLVPAGLQETLLHLIKSKDRSTLSQYQGYQDLKQILDGLTQLGIPFEYDICIVRGHSYYKGMVCEWFEQDDISLGSLAAGGRYDHITDFIDPKQSFSGVGTSLGRFVYLAVQRAVEAQTTKKSDSYLIVQFEDSFEQALRLYRHLGEAGLSYELYPTAAKLSKQFEYADKKNMTHVVMYGSNEQQNNCFVLKNLSTGEQTAKHIEHSYGIIPMRQTEDGRQVLLAKSVYGHRSCPKGHPESGETSIQTAIRECTEETNLTVNQLYTNTHTRISGSNQEEVLTLEEVFIKQNDGNLKIVTYYIAQVSGQESHQQEEITELRRCSLTEAQELATYPEAKQLMKKYYNIFNNI